MNRQTRSPGWMPRPLQEGGEGVRAARAGRRRCSASRRPRSPPRAAPACRRGPSWQMRSLQCQPMLMGSPGCSPAPARRSTSRNPCSRSSYETGLLMRSPFGRLYGFTDDSRTTLAIARSRVCVSDTNQRSAPRAPASASRRPYSTQARRPRRRAPHLRLAPRGAVTILGAQGLEHGLLGREPRRVVRGRATLGLAVRDLGGGEEPGGERLRVAAGAPAPSAPPRARPRRSR